MNKSAYCSNAYRNLKFSRMLQIRLCTSIKAKGVTSAYEIKFQFNCTKLYLSKYTSLHIV